MTEASADLESPEDLAPGMSDLLGEDADAPVTEDAESGADLLGKLGITFGEEETSFADDDYEPISVQSVSDSVELPPSFSISRFMFTSMMAQAMLVVPTRDFYPALKNVVIDVVGGPGAESRLTITGSDATSTVISTTTVVKVVRPGRVLIGAKRFSDVVSLAAGAEISVDVDATNARVSSGQASWSLRVAAVQEYPPLPDLGDLAWSEVDRHAFKRAVSGTRYSASSDDAKDHLQQVDIAGGVVTASDGLRFAQTTENLPSGLACQVSASGLDLIAKMLDHNDAAEFRIADGEWHTVAEIGPPSSPDRVIVAHLMRPFPDDARAALAVPLADNRDLLTMNASTLIEALKRAAPTSDEETRAVALRVGVPENGQVTVESKNRYGELSREVLEGSFVVAGTEDPAAARSVLVSHAHLRDAVSAAVSATALPEEAAGSVRMLLGEARSKSKPAFVLVQDAGETVSAVLAQVRSDWMS